MLALTLLTCLKKKTCLQKCADRFLKHSELVYARFDELRQNVSFQVFIYFILMNTI